MTSARLSPFRIAAKNGPLPKTADPHFGCFFVNPATAVRIAAYVKEDDMSGPSGPLHKQQ